MKNKVLTWAKNKKYETNSSSFKKNYFQCHISIERLEYKQ